MSKRVLNPNQLQMFMKPSEIRKSLTGSVDGMPVDPNEDWGVKSNPDLRDNIARHGVSNPIILDHGSRTALQSTPNWRGPTPVNPVTMGNGHHRVQNALEVERAGKEIHLPVLHTENDYMGQRNDLYETYPKLGTYSWPGRG